MLQFIHDELINIPNGWYVDLWILDSTSGATEWRISPIKETGEEHRGTAPNQGQALMACELLFLQLGIRKYPDWEKGVNGWKLNTQYGKATFFNSMGDLWHVTITFPNQTDPGHSHSMSLPLTMTVKQVQEAVEAWLRHFQVQGIRSLL